MPSPRRAPRRPDTRHLPTPNAGRRIARKAAERSHPADGKGTAAGASPRFRQVHAALDKELRQRFPQAEPVEAYGMPGWRIARPRPVEWTHGTIDPNLVQVFLAERAQGGLSLHLWNPYDPALLSKHQEDLEDAGFKVMVGCLQYKRKADYPLDAVLPVFDGIADAMEKDSGKDAGKEAGKATKAGKGAARAGKAGSKPGKPRAGKGTGKGRSKA